MKTKLLFFAVLFAVQTVSARDHVIVVKGETPIKKGSTEVTDDPDTLRDTISVVPSYDATEIYVTLRDANGTVLQQYCLDALSEDSINIISPSLPDGYYLEVCDDRGVAYTKYEN